MKQRESGFTIIETSLVLAITGLVVALTLIGIGNSLNHQRYTDAVNQAVDFFRGQYAQASSTVNNRPTNEDCGSTGITTGGTPSIRGASNCLLVGKILRSTSGQDVTVSQVLALNDPSSLSAETIAAMNDTQILAAAQLEQGNVIETYKADWGTTFLVPGSSSPATFSVMIVRTPVTGTVRTYSSSSPTVLASDLLAGTPDDMRFCLDQSASFSVGVKPMGINITKGAVNTTGVRIIPAGECV